MSEQNEILTPEDVKELAPLYDAVILALKQVYDPEIPVNIYDLGLIYELNISKAREVYIKMTFTAPNGTLGSSGDNPRVFFNDLGAGLLGFATVGGAPAYYDLVTGVRAYTLAEGLEFNGTTDQTGLDTKYSVANLHQPLNAARQVGQGDAANLLKRGPRLGGVVGGGPAQVWVVFDGQSAVMHQAAAVAAPSLVPSVVFSGQGEAFV